MNDIECLLALIAQRDELIAKLEQRIEEQDHLLNLWIEFHKRNIGKGKSLVFSMGV